MIFFCKIFIVWLNVIDSLSPLIPNRINPWISISNHVIVDTVSAHENDMKIIPNVESRSLWLYSLLCTVHENWQRLEWWENLFTRRRGKPGVTTCCCVANRYLPHWPKSVQSGKNYWKICWGIFLQSMESLAIELAEITSLSTRFFFQPLEDVNVLWDETDAINEYIKSSLTAFGSAFSRSFSSGMDGKLRANCWNLRLNEIVFPMP